jgi:hypothetical protein
MVRKHRRTELVPRFRRTLGLSRGFSSFQAASSARVLRCHVLSSARQRLHRQRQHLLVEVPDEIGSAYMGSDYVGEIRRPIKATLRCGGVHRFTNGNRQPCRNYIARTEMRSARPIWSSHVADLAGQFLKPMPTRRVRVMFS